MICAAKRADGYSFGSPLVDKSAILTFLRSHNPTGYGEGYVEDFVSGASTGIPDNAYEIGDLFWRDRDIYNFERHDLVLRPDFLASVREQLAG